MKLVTVEQMRALERKTIEQGVLTGEALMERAGEAMANWVEYVAQTAGLGRAPVSVIAGRGNNGGDGFVTARFLRERGWDVEVLLAADTGSIGGDALIHLGKLKAAGVTPFELPELADWEEERAVLEDGIIVDAVLGTGIKGPVRGPAAGAIRHINELAARNLVFAMDVPSGLDADTGTAEGEVVTADMTITFGYPKRGLVQESALEYVGTLEVADIGLVRGEAAGNPADPELLTAAELRGLLGRRQRLSHKGSYGHVLVVAGAAGYSGAAVLAAEGALRAGAGLVSVLTPRSVAPVVAGCVPEAMVHPGEETETGSLAPECLDRWIKTLGDFQAILVGPGLTIHDQTRRTVERLISTSRAPVVMDADAINVSAGRLNIVRGASSPLVLTPHPGEMGRLLNCHIADVQANRAATAVRAAAATGAVIVLKGAGTLITAKGAQTWINVTGNPGMATGGTGDVLGGLVAGFCAQKVDPYDAARMAVFIHGWAGDMAAWRHGQAAMLAGDLVEELPAAMRRLTVR
jgi:NAD(P)H-hydrate epimerase